MMGLVAFQRIVLAAALLFLAFLGYVAPLTAKGERATTLVVEDYYRHYNDRDFRYICDELLGDQAKAVVTPAQFQMVYAKLGSLRTKSRQSFKLLDLRGNRFYYRFSASYEKGDVIDSFTLKEAGDHRYRLEHLPNSSFACPR